MPALLRTEHLHEGAGIGLEVVKLFISPAHNYFGRHGQPAGRNPLVEKREIECVAGRGVAGDRFFNFKTNYKGQITFFSAEIFEEVCRTLGVMDKCPGVARRNVVTRGVDLNTLIGRRFAMQGVEFEGVSECSPCYWMNQAIAPGAEAALQGHGGLRARILTSGSLSVD
jgi:MOSC domain-containing protein YiiM